MPNDDITSTYYNSQDQHIPYILLSNQKIKDDILMEILSNAGLTFPENVNSLYISPVIDNTTLKRALNDPYYTKGIKNYITLSMNGNNTTPQMDDINIAKFITLLKSGVSQPDVIEKLKNLFGSDEYSYMHDKALNYTQGIKDFDDIYMPYYYKYGIRGNYNHNLINFMAGMNYISRLTTDYIKLPDSIHKYANLMHFMHPDVVSQIVSYGTKSKYYHGYGDTLKELIKNDSTYIRDNFDKDNESAYNSDLAKTLVPDYINYFTEGIFSYFAPHKDSDIFQTRKHVSDYVLNPAPYYLINHLQSLFNLNGTTTDFSKLTNDQYWANGRGGSYQSRLNKITLPLNLFDDPDTYIELLEAALHEFVHSSTNHSLMKYGGNPVNANNISKQYEEITTEMIASSIFDITPVYQELIASGIPALINLAPNAFSGMTSYFDVAELFADEFMSNIINGESRFNLNAIPYMNNIYPAGYISKNFDWYNIIPAVHDLESVMKKTINPLTYDKDQFFKMISGSNYNRADLNYGSPTDKDGLYFYMSTKTGNGFDDISFSNLDKLSDEAIDIIDGMFEEGSSPTLSGLSYASKRDIIQDKDSPFGRLYKFSQPRDERLLSFTPILDDKMSMVDKIKFMSEHIDDYHYITGDKDLANVRQINTNDLRLFNEYNKQLAKKGLRTPQHKEAWTIIHGRSGNEKQGIEEIKGQSLVGGLGKTLHTKYSDSDILSAIGIKDVKKLTIGEQRYQYEKGSTSVIDRRELGVVDTQDYNSLLYSYINESGYTKQAIENMTNEEKMQLAGEIISKGTFMLPEELAGISPLPYFMTDSVPLFIDQTMTPFRDDPDFYRAWLESHNIPYIMPNANYSQEEYDAIGNYENDSVIDYNEHLPNYKLISSKNSFVEALSEFADNFGVTSEYFTSHPELADKLAPLLIAPRGVNPYSGMTAKTAVLPGDQQKVTHNKKQMITEAKFDPRTGKTSENGKLSPDIFEPIIFDNGESLFQVRLIRPTDSYGSIKLRTKNGKQETEYDSNYVWEFTLAGNEARRKKPSNEFDSPYEYKSKIDYVPGKTFDIDEDTIRQIEEAKKQRLEKVLSQQNNNVQKNVKDDLPDDIKSDIGPDKITYDDIDGAGYIKINDELSELINDNFNPDAISNWYKEHNIKPSEMATAILNPYDVVDTNVVDADFVDVPNTQNTTEERLFTAVVDSNAFQNMTKKYPQLALAMAKKLATLNSMREFVTRTDGKLEPEVEEYILDKINSEFETGITHGITVQNSHQPYSEAMLSPVEELFNPDSIQLNEVYNKQLAYENLLANGIPLQNELEPDVNGMLVSPRLLFNPDDILDSMPPIQPLTDSFKFIDAGQRVERRSRNNRRNKKSDPTKNNTFNSFSEDDVNDVREIVPLMSNNKSINNTIQSLILSLNPNLKTSEGRDEYRKALKTKIRVAKTKVTKRINKMNKMQKAVEQLANDKTNTLKEAISLKKKLESVAKLEEATTRRLSTRIIGDAKKLNKAYDEFASEYGLYNSGIPVENNQQPYSAAMLSPAEELFNPDSIQLNEAYDKQLAYENLFMNGVPLQNELQPDVNGMLVSPRLLFNPDDMLDSIPKGEPLYLSMKKQPTPVSNKRKLVEKQKITVFNNSQRYYRNMSDKQIDDDYKKTLAYENNLDNVVEENSIDPLGDMRIEHLYDPNYDVLPSEALSILMPMYASLQHPPVVRPSYDLMLTRPLIDKQLSKEYFDFLLQETKYKNSIKEYVPDFSMYEGNLPPEKEYSEEDMDKLLLQEYKEFQKRADPYQGVLAPFEFSTHVYYEKWLDILAKANKESGEAMIETLFKDENGKPLRIKAKVLRGMVNLTPDMNGIVKQRFGMIGKEYGSIETPTGIVPSRNGSTDFSFEGTWLKDILGYDKIVEDINRWHEDAKADLVRPLTWDEEHALAMQGRPIPIRKQLDNGYVGEPTSWLDEWNTRGYLNTTLQRVFEKAPESLLEEPLDVFLGRKSIQISAPGSNKSVSREMEYRVTPTGHITTLLLDPNGNVVSREDNQAFYNKKGLPKYDLPEYEKIMQNMLPRINIPDSEKYLGQRALPNGKNVVYSIAPNGKKIRARYISEDGKLTSTTDKSPAHYKNNMIYRTYQDVVSGKIGSAFDLIDQNYVDYYDENGNPDKNILTFANRKYNNKLSTNIKYVDTADTENKELGMGTTTYGRKELDEAYRYTTRRNINRMDELMNTSFGLHILSSYLYPVKYILKNIFDSIVNIFSEYEKKYVDYAAKARSVSSSGVLSSSDIIKAAGENVYSAADIVSVSERYAASGINTANSMQEMTYVIKAATIAQADYNTVANAAIKAQMAFGLQTKDVSMITDAWIAGANASTAELDDMITGFQYVASSAKNAGLSVQDTAAYLAMLDSQGLANTATSFRQLLLTFRQPAKRQKFSALFGFTNEDFSDMNKVFKTVRDYVNDSPNETERNRRLLQVSDALGGKVQGFDALQAYINISEEQMQMITNAVSQAGVTEQMYNEVTDNIIHKSAAMQTELQSSFTIFGQYLSPFLSVVIDSMTSMLNIVNTLPTPIHILMSLFGSLTIAATTAATAMTGIVGAGMTISSLFYRAHNSVLNSDVFDVERAFSIFNSDGDKTKVSALLADWKSLDPDNNVSSSISEDILRDIYKHDRTQMMTQRYKTTRKNSVYESLLNMAVLKELDLRTEFGNMSMDDMIYKQHMIAASLTSDELKDDYYKQIQPLYVGKVSNKLKSIKKRLTPFIDFSAGNAAWLERQKKGSSLMNTVGVGLSGLGMKGGSMTLFGQTVSNAAIGAAGIGIAGLLVSTVAYNKASEAMEKNNFKHAKSLALLGAVASEAAVAIGSAYLMMTPETAPLGVALLLGGSLYNAYKYNATKRDINEAQYKATAEQYAANGYGSKVTINNYNTDVGEVYNYNSPNLQNYYAYPTINPFGFY